MDVKIITPNIDHYERVKAIAEADAIETAKSTLADNPDLLAKVLANPSTSVIGLLIADTITYAIQSAKSIQDAHHKIHALIAVLDSVHQQIATADPDTYSENTDADTTEGVAPTPKTYVN